MIDKSLDRKKYYETGVKLTFLYFEMKQIHNKKKFYVRHA